MKSTPTQSLNLVFHSAGVDQPQARSLRLDDLVVASWTGRDRAAMETRLVELEAMGIPRPPSTPILYRIAASRATTATIIEVVGEQTSGEVEFVLLSAEDRLWVGLGSDHTDREAEAHDAALAKQLCEKPIASNFWALDDVVGHWDELRLRSYVTDSSGVRQEYQSGTVATMLPPHELASMRDVALKRTASATSLLFCGTLPTIGPIRSAQRFEIELLDPVLERRLSHLYEIIVLPSHTAVDAPK